MQYTNNKTANITLPNLPGTEGVVSGSVRLGQSRAETTKQTL